MLVDLYGRCVAHGDGVEARRQLKLNQREHIAWERDTVWRQMINQARRGEDSNGIHFGGSLIVEPEKGLLNVQTPAGRIKITTKKVYLLLAVAVFAALLNIQVVDGVEANKCFAILVFATILWATEAIPLFVTSTFIPLLLVVLRVIRSADGEALEPPAATKYVLPEPRGDVYIDLAVVLQARLLCHVLANNHAAHRRFHNSICPEQDGHRPRSDHQGAQPSGRTAEHSSTGVYGCCMFCQHVDQQRSCAHPLFYAHSSA